MSISQVVPRVPGIHQGAQVHHGGVQEDQGPKEALRGAAGLLPPEGQV